jgi:hypothetical protein
VVVDRGCMVGDVAAEWGIIGKGWWRCCSGIGFVVAECEGSGCCLWWGWVSCCRGEVMPSEDGVEGSAMSMSSGSSAWGVSWVWTEDVVRIDGGEA